MVEKIAGELSGKKKTPILFTRLSRQKFESLSCEIQKKLNYDDESMTAFLHGTHRRVRSARVALVTAGTSDLPAAKEASRTLEYLGIPNEIFSDLGVAGIWRLFKKLPAINRADLVIAFAGMDAAIISVLGGLTKRPIIAVPTSVGYGSSEEGKTALFAMLASCAPGILVTNIDNGYGAACAAYRILIK